MKQKKKHCESHRFCLPMCCTDGHIRVIYGCFFGFVWQFILFFSVWLNGMLKCVLSLYNFFFFSFFWFVVVESKSLFGWWWFGVFVVVVGGYDGWVIVELVFWLVHMCLCVCYFICIFFFRLVRRGFRL